MSRDTSDPTKWFCRHMEDGRQVTKRLRYACAHASMRCIACAALTAAFSKAPACLRTCHAPEGTQHQRTLLKDLPVSYSHALRPHAFCMTEYLSLSFRPLLDLSILHHPGKAWSFPAALPASLPDFSCHCFFFLGMYCTAVRRVHPPKNGVARAGAPQQPPSRPASAPSNPAASPAHKRSSPLPTPPQVSQPASQPQPQVTQHHTQPQMTQHPQPQVSQSQPTMPHSHQHPVLSQQQSKAVQQQPAIIQLPPTVTQPQHLSHHPAAHHSQFPLSQPTHPAADRQTLQQQMAAHKPALVSHLTQQQPMSQQLPTLGLPQPLSGAQQQTLSFAQQPLPFAQQQTVSLSQQPPQGLAYRTIISGQPRGGFAVHQVCCPPPCISEYSRLCGVVAVHGCPAHLHKTDGRKGVSDVFLRWACLGHIAHLRAMHWLSTAQRILSARNQ